MPITLPVGGLTAFSLTLTGIVVGNAYYQKKQFYPSVVYITKSNPSLAAIYFLAFTLVMLLGKLLKNVFFGQLRSAEFEQLLEHSFYAVTETCLAFTVFRDDFSPKFVSLFTVLLFLKAFHYLTDSRVDFMERSPVITALFHIRVTSLLLLLMVFDLLLLNHSYLSTIAHGASVQLVFGFEYAVLLTAGCNIAVKYICHLIDLRSENPWENKAVYLLYTELLVGFAKVVLYTIFVFIMIKIHTFPLFILRPMYLTLRSFKNALNDVIQSRRAIHNMNTLYPDATPEELAAVDNVCIICREEMITGAKKLPCGHIFHSSCLRSWFQRQQTCPTCRMDILQQSVPILTQAPQQQPPQHQGAAVPQQQQQQEAQPQEMQPQQPPNIRLNQPLGNQFAAVTFGQNLPQGLRVQFPFTAIPFNNLNQDYVPPATAHTNSSPTSSTTTTSPTTSSQKTGFPFGAMPPFVPFMPFSIPPPPLPPNFEGLTLDELKKMEGNERAHVEARIKTLKNIQVLLDAAAIQLSQYNAIMSSLEAQTLVSKQAVEKSSHSETKENASPTSEVPNGGPPIELASASSVPLSSTMGEAEPSALESFSEPSSVLSSGPSPSQPASKEDDNNDPDDPNEIRRRRLEKFTLPNDQGDSPSVPLA